MIVISEYKLPQETIKEYLNKGYRFAYGYEHPSIGSKESVGILLDTLYKPTIDLIERLLYFKHKVTLKFEDQVYKLHSLDEWKYTYQSDKDTLHTASYKHPILIEYQRRKKEYFEHREIKILEDQYAVIYEDYVDIPDDQELESFVRTFAYLYQVDVNYKDRLDLIRAYYQLKYYLDNDIPYSNEPHAISIDEEPMFNSSQFKSPEYQDEISVESFGNETYLEDYIYKNQNLI